METREKVRIEMCGVLDDLGVSLSEFVSRDKPANVVEARRRCSVIAHELLCDHLDSGEIAAIVGIPRSTYESGRRSWRCVEDCD